MHRSKKIGTRSKRSRGQSVTQKSEIKNNSSGRDVSDVIESLLTDVIDISDDEDPNVTLKENSNESFEKEYINACEYCDFSITAGKKYVAVQLLLKHKDECHHKTCSDCEFKAKNLQEMKRHIRDVHTIAFSSTSPPLKKKRMKRNDSIESMDIATDVLDISVEKEEDISFKFEEMEIDESEDATEKEFRSRMWDDKIKVKENKIKRG